MSDKKVYYAIGLMSGTSLDGVDAALIETDGYDYVKPLGFVTVPYDDAVRAEIRKAFGQSDVTSADVIRAQDLVTNAHIEVIKNTEWLDSGVDIIGFHGQTIFHAPERGVTIQIGDGQAMADALNVDVIADFRANDVENGGQGAPLAPLYHTARAKSDGVDIPCAFLNIGGVANATYINDRDGGDLDILAFDTGPGNALMDDWVKMRSGRPYDKDGELAAAGDIISHVLHDWLTHPYFIQQPPKSLDRDEWDIADFGRNVRDIDQISTEDGAATLLEFTAQSILKARDLMGVQPTTWYACGGGRHNVALMKRLAQDINIKPVENLGWDGDATEAECFGYLAVRSILGLPISCPTTTGVRKPLIGGVRFNAS